MTNEQRNAVNKLIAHALDVGDPGVFRDGWLYRSVEDLLELQRLAIEAKKQVASP